MPQYRITSADFYAPGDTGDPTTVLDPSDPYYNVATQSTPTIPSLFSPVVTAPAVEPTTILRERKYEQKS